jgi:acetate kinase
MAAPPTSRVLTLNIGSSSLKFAVYEMGEAETRVLAGALSGIGAVDGDFALVQAGLTGPVAQRAALPDHRAAVRVLFEWFGNQAPTIHLDVAAHRIVHGGSRFSRTEAVTAGLLQGLAELVPLAPLHLRAELDALEEVASLRPELAQVACFDTAFHRHLPPVARLYALPEMVRRLGIERYGFHGLSYEYVIGRLAEAAGREAALGRVIIAHLGHGASMAALRDGKSVETTMGLTPAGGLVMSTRSGDLDPGVLIHLIEQRGLRVSEVARAVNLEGGLLGVSGVSADMKQLLALEATSPAAARAVELFCYQARKFLGALAAVLGGVDTLIFTGGIGEHAAPVRERVVEGLEFLGLSIDPKRNIHHAPIISPDGARVTVRVIPTNEELMLARHAAAALRGQA